MPKKRWTKSQDYISSPRLENSDVSQVNRKFLQTKIVYVSELAGRRPVALRREKHWPISKNLPYGGHDDVRLLVTDASGRSHAVRVESCNKPKFGLWALLKHYTVDKHAVTNLRQDVGEGPALRPVFENQQSKLQPK